LGRVDVYTATGAIEALTVAELLREAGLDATVREMGIYGYPMSIGPLGEKRISVPREEAEEAREILLRAAEDGVIDHGPELTSD